MTNRKLFAVYLKQDGTPGDGGAHGAKAYVTGPTSVGVLMCGKVPAMVFHVTLALETGKMPKATKPYPHAAMWAVMNGYANMVPAILAACDKVAGHIGNSDGYSDDLATVKGNLSKMLPSPTKAAEPKALPEPKVEPKAIAVVTAPEPKVLVPDAINPPEIIIIAGGRWLDITPEELEATAAAYQEEIDRKAAEKAALAAKEAAKYAAQPKPLPKLPPKPKCFIDLD